MEKLVKVTRENKIPLTIIGNASNLIIRDGGIDGLVIILTDLKKIEVKGKDVYLPCNILPCI